MLVCISPFVLITLNRVRLISYLKQSVLLLINMACNCHSMDSLWCGTFNSLFKFYFLLPMFSFRFLYIGNASIVYYLIKSPSFIENEQKKTIFLLYKNLFDRISHHQLLNVQSYKITK